MDDGKSIRYKDLYALFEHILEKTMRQEQRDWSESPVKVWVNTFKVFLDEFMTEYKPLDSTITKVKTRDSLLTAQENRQSYGFWILTVKRRYAPFELIQFWGITKGIHIK